MTHRKVLMLFGVSQDAAKVADLQAQLARTQIENQQLIAAKQRADVDLTNANAAVIAANAKVEEATRRAGAGAGAGAVYVAPAAWLSARR